MKHIFKTLFIFLLFSLKVNGQVIDSLNYLKQFEINKVNYINKPFSYLLNNMYQLQPKTVWSLSMRNNKTLVKNTMFKFCNMDESFNNTITLYITWETPISRSETKNLSSQNNFYFTNDEKAFYGSKIIKDISVYRH